MTEASSLQEAITLAAQSWPSLPGSGDPNTADVYWHAHKVAALIRSKLPVKLPMKEIGVALVECVENNFIKGYLIRHCLPQELAERGEKLIECIQRGNLLNVGLREAYVVALYTWHGCINMAKLLRKTTSSGELYTHKMRWQGYNWLKQCWHNEDNRGNPWLRYGVSLARLLEKKRENPIVEDWVPKESPYWDC